VLSYSGAGRELVARLKYRNARSSVPWLAAAMAAVAAPASGPGAELVTWVPTTPSRRRGRGYDQAELLARGVARSTGVPCRRLLRRREGRAQTGLSRAERLAGPILEPATRWGRPVRAPATVLLVDDVVTTGATMAAASAVLSAMGAVRIAGVAAARTPARPPPSSPRPEPPILA
jgi:predicted amidophosphoribosyltransferase